MLRVAAAVLTVLSATAPAQDAPVRFVDGRPMLRVTLRAGEASYPCHVLIDLTRREPLHLHDNAAQSLGALQCEVSVDGSDLVFRDLPVDGSRDSWLEGFTKEHAEELQEVPVAGFLGVAAFQGKTLVLDGPDAKLRVLASGSERPPAGRGRGSADLAADPAKRGVTFHVQFAAEGDAGSPDTRGVVALHTKEGASMITSRLARAISAPAGRVARARVDAADLAAVTPFRPELVEGQGLVAALGGRALARLRTTISLGSGWVSFEVPDDAVYPEDEAAYYAALYGERSIDSLAAFLAGHPDSAFAPEAARTRLALLVESGVDRDAIVAGAQVAIEAAPAKARAREALAILENLPGGSAWAEARAAIAEKGLSFALEDEDGNANHELHLELGRMARAANDLREARRHLLSAAFGMRGGGVANLELGRLYEQQGEPERAMSRYLIAMLDMKNTGEAGLEALQDLYAAENGSTDGLAAHLAEMAEGRVPALHPIPREPDEVQKTGRVVLAELFTGAMCPPCAAADVAFDALGEFFDADEVVLLQWHLPIPAPEPLVSQVALDRAQQKGVRGTPTAVFGGTAAISGGGKADQAPNVFAKYRDAVEPLLAAPQQIELVGDARVEGRALRLTAFARVSDPGDLRLHAILTEDTLVFPGRNGILFHHHVARARITPADGVPIELAMEDLPFEGNVSLRDVEADLDMVVASLERRGPFRIRPVEPARDALHVVLFVEDPASGQVVQAASVRVVPGS